MEVWREGGALASRRPPCRDLGEDLGVALGSFFVGKVALACSPVSEVKNLYTEHRI